MMRCTWPVNADASSPSPSELNCYIFPATLMTSPFLMTLYDTNIACASFAYLFVHVFLSLISRHVWEDICLL